MSKHSRERALQRYNIQLSKSDEQDILEKIRNNQIISLGASEKDKKKIFAYVEHNHIPLKVLYERTNKGPKSIITVYPFDVDEYNELTKENFQRKINNAIAFLKKNKYIVYKRNVNKTS